MEKQWVVYMLECKGGSLYTGITDDFEKRFKAHQQGKGAKYTRGRGPLTLRYMERCDTQGDALRREYAIKQLPRTEKLKLCEAWATSGATRV